MKAMIIVLKMMIQIVKGLIIIQLKIIIKKKKKISINKNKHKEVHPFTIDEDIFQEKDDIITEKTTNQTPNINKNNKKEIKKLNKKIKNEFMFNKSPNIKIKNNNTILLSGGNMKMKGMKERRRK